MPFFYWYQFLWTVLGFMAVRWKRAPSHGADETSAPDYETEGPAEEPVAVSAGQAHRAR